MVGAPRPPPGRQPGAGRGDGPRRSRDPRVRARPGPVGRARRRGKTGGISTGRAAGAGRRPARSRQPADRAAGGSGAGAGRAGRRERRGGYLCRGGRLALRPAAGRACGGDATPQAGGWADRLSVGCRPQGRWHPLYCLYPFQPQVEGVAASGRRRTPPCPGADLDASRGVQPAHSGGPGTALCRAVPTRRGRGRAAAGGWRPPRLRSDCSPGPGVESPRRARCSWSRSPTPGFRTSRPF